MCRFVLYLGPPVTLSALLVEPSHSLINQSAHAREREEPLNGDGFGVAWYAPEIAPEPASFRSTSPAWNNANLTQLARVTRSGCILAHVRAATQGLAVADANCHPFTHRELAFMHNGNLGAFRMIRRRLLQSLSDEAFHAIGGSTDSEHVFALFIDRLRERARTGDAGEPEALAGALVDAVREVVALSREANPEARTYLNLAVANGRAAVACRYSTDPNRSDTLYYLQGDRYTCEAGRCGMAHSGEERGAVLIASERLTDEPEWRPIPVGHLVLVDGRGAAELRAWPED